MKYRILKDIPEHNWLAGDVVSIVGKFSDEGGVLEEVSEDTPNQHVQVVVDPIKVGSFIKM